LRIHRHYATKDRIARIFCLLSICDDPRPMDAKHIYATEFNGEAQKLARDRLLELNASPA